MQFVYNYYCIKYALNRTMYLASYGLETEKLYSNQLILIQEIAKVFWVHSWCVHVWTNFGQLHNEFVLQNRDFKAGIIKGGDSTVAISVLSTLSK